MIAAQPPFPGLPKHEPSVKILIIKDIPQINLVFDETEVFANTLLNELDVLKSLHKIEHKLGRRRKIVNEPRVIDLDLIDYSNKILKNNQIINPHPRAHKRRFVMEPLAELDPNWVHPTLKRNVCTILEKLGNQNIKIINKKKLI